VIVTGCGPKAEDKLMKEKIELLNSMAAEFEKVNNAASFAKAQQDFTPLAQKLAQVDTELAALPKEAQDAAVQAHKAELDAAMARFAKAKTEASKKRRAG